MLYYCKTGNFGDDLNPWLWSRLAPEVCDAAQPALFLGIGTILHDGVPAAPVTVVFGSGWSGERRPLMDRRWIVYCVRGPLTAAGLNLDAALAVADPAILVRSIPLPPQTKRFQLSFMPHHRSMTQADWPMLCNRAGIHCIDPRGGVDLTLAQIQQTEVLLAEAMHGAIVADALRVPWIPVRLYSHFHEFKWRDWTQSLRLPFQPATVPPLFAQQADLPRRLVHAAKKGLARAGVGKDKWNRLPLRASSDADISTTLRALEHAPRAVAPRLSEDQDIEQAETRLRERLADLREAWPPQPASNARNC